MPSGDVSGWDELNGIDWDDDQDIRSKVTPIDCFGRPIDPSAVYYIDKPIGPSEKLYLRELFRNPHHYEMFMANGEYEALVCRVCRLKSAKAPKEINSSHTYVLVTK